VKRNKTSQLCLHNSEKEIKVLFIKNDQKKKILNDACGSISQVRKRTFSRNIYPSLRIQIHFSFNSSASKIDK
jgi:hypothetical protein